MLDTFLKVAYERDSKLRERDRIVELMQQLPEEYLYKLASGEEKLAFGDKPETWLEQFKGTPLFDQAMEIEKKDLELQLLQQQQRQEDDIHYREEATQRDELCIQRKMLELELAGLPSPEEEALETPEEEAAEQAAGAPEVAVPSPEAAPAPPQAEKEAQAAWDRLELSTGDKMKVAYISMCNDWVEKFKGTPLFDQAVAIEQQELDMQMARMQRRNERRLNDDQLWNQKDQLRAQRKMLTLELLKLQNAGQAPDKPVANDGDGNVGMVVEAGLNFRRALVKQAKELTMPGRERIKSKNFAIPKGNGPGDTGKYPIHDEAHARNALTRVRQFGSSSERARVYSAVASKYPGLASRSSTPAVEKKAFAPALMAAGKSLAGGLGAAAKAAPGVLQRAGTALPGGTLASGAKAVQRAAAPHVQKAVQYAKANPLQAAGIAGATGLGAGMMMG